MAVAPPIPDAVPTEDGAPVGRIGCALLEADGAWAAVDTALCELLGRSEEELLASPVAAVFNPDDLARERVRLEHLLAAVRQKLPRDTGRAVGRPVDLGDVVRPRIAGRQRALEKAAEAGDDGHHVVDFVGDAARHARDRLHPPPRELRLGIGEQDALALVRSPPDPPSQLVQLREPEPLRALDQHLEGDPRDRRPV